VTTVQAAQAATDRYWGGARGPEGLNVTHLAKEAGMDRRSTGRLIQLVMTRDNVSGLIVTGGPDSLGEGILT